jgi:hypothetical protein
LGNMAFRIVYSSHQFAFLPVSETSQKSVANDVNPFRS